MLGENTEDSDKTYNYHLLAGHFVMLDDVNEDDALKEMESTESLLSEAKSKKGLEKTRLLGNSLIHYAKALTLYDKCKIEDNEGLLCFVCTRYPDLELDWTTLQKILLLLRNEENKIDHQELKTLELAVIIYNSAIIEKINNIKIQ
ncbi:MAG: hypothetical protein ACP5N3_05735 [Candidatus Nanoarchaeia archaeon]